MEQVSTGGFTDLDAGKDGAALVKLMEYCAEFSGIQLIRALMCDAIKADYAPGQKVLVGGCGYGEQAYELATHMPEASIVGLDFSEMMLGLARERYNRENISYVQGDLTGLDYDDNQFDIIHIERVLHHIPEAGQAFSEIVRVLKPGGLLAINEPDFSTTHFYPMPERINCLHANLLLPTIASGDFGKYLLTLMRAYDFDIMRHDAIDYLFKDYAIMAEYTQFISLLETVLAEQGRLDLLEQLKQADKQKAMYFNMPSYLGIGRLP